MCYWLRVRGVYCELRVWYLDEYIKNNATHTSEKQCNTPGKEGGPRDGDSDGSAGLQLATI